MTDDKVKEAVERVRVVARQGDPCGPWADDLNAVLSSHDALQADLEREKAISAERWVAKQGLMVEVADLRAKLTALVEVVEAARDLVMKPGGLVNRGVGVGLVVVEKADKSDPHYRLCAAFEKLDAQALAHHSAPVGEAEPIPMLLFCPNCGVQHVDAPKICTMGVGCLEVGACFASANNQPDRCDAWTNPPHRSHLCGSCGCIWRPADVPTEGVKAIETRGKADTWAAPPTTPTSAPVEGEGLCSDCPPVGYITDKTRCLPCPRRAPDLIQPQGEERS